MKCSYHPQPQCTTAASAWTTGIVSASPNTPSTHPLPVYLTSVPHSKAAAAAAASVYRHAADKPGHMNVAIQYSAGRSTRRTAQLGPTDIALAAALDAATAAPAPAIAAVESDGTAAAEAAAAPAADDVVAALWDDDGDDYAGAGGDYDDDTADAAHDDAAAGDADDAAGQEELIEPSLESEAAGIVDGVAAVNSHSAGTLSPPPRLTPEPPAGGSAAAAAAAAAGGAVAARRRYQSIATPREGRQAKSRKSLAGKLGRYHLLIGSGGCTTCCCLQPAISCSCGA